MANGGVEGLLLPLLESQVENNDAKGQNKGDVDDAEDSETDGIWSYSTCTFVQITYGRR